MVYVNSLDPDQHRQNEETNSVNPEQTAPIGAV